MLSRTVFALRIGAILSAFSSAGWHLRIPNRQAIRANRNVKLRVIHRRRVIHKRAVNHTKIRRRRIGIIKITIAIICRTITIAIIAIAIAIIAIIVIAIAIAMVITVIVIG